VLQGLLEARVEEAREILTAPLRAARPVDPNANVVVKAAAWLRENL
jgi:hypothetical protein